MLKFDRHCSSLMLPSAKLDRCVTTPSIYEKDLENWLSISVADLTLPDVAAPERH